MNATVTRCARRAAARMLGTGSLRYEKRLGARRHRRHAHVALAGWRGGDLDIHPQRPRTGWDVW